RTRSNNRGRHTHLAWSPVPAGPRWSRAQCWTASSVLVGSEDRSDGLLARQASSVAVDKEEVHLAPMALPRALPIRIDARRGLDRLGNAQGAEPVVGVVDERPGAGMGHGGEAEDLRLV